MRVTKGNDNDWFFRLFQDAGVQGRLLADYARYQLGTREMAVIRETGTAGKEFASGRPRSAKSEGIRIDADLEFAPGDARDSSAN